MKKKTYKQMQNRLYREIKRRQLAERQAINPKRMSYQSRTIPIETIKTKRLIDPEDITKYAEETIEYTKQDIANAMGQKLLESGYIAFYNHGIGGMGMNEIEAVLHVVKPRDKSDLFGEKI